MIVSNALFNDSSGELSNEERTIFGLEPKQESKVVTKVYQILQSVCRYSMVLYQYSLTVNDKDMVPYY